MFYDVFSEMCLKNGVSKNKAAQEIGLSNSIVTRWKKTGSTPNGVTMAKIANYFGVSVDSLLGLESEPKEEAKAPESSNVQNTNTSAAEEAIKAALWHDDTDLTKEDIDDLWEDIRAYKDFRTDQRRKQKK